MQLHSSSGRWRLGLALSLLTSLLWGILPIALKLTLQALDVYTVTWFRFIVSFGLLAVYLATRQQLPELQKLRTTNLGLIAIAIIFLSANYLLFLIGLSQTSPANTQVLIQLAPVLMGLGGLAIFKEHYTLQQWIGLGVLTLGFALFFHEQLRTLISAQTQYLIGSGIVVIAAAVWAVYALAQKQLLQKLPSASIMLILYGGCAILFTPFAAPQSLLTLSPLHWASLLFCALNTLIAYGAFAEAMDHWEASRVSAVLALTPLITMLSVGIFSSVFPYLLRPEHLTILAVVGAILVVGGSVTIAIGKSR
ncbi:MAG TPA: DMT family transporter [Kamptonema sp.]|nr:DMT family transporter [Kamptonema sp.]